jgi:UDP-glucose 4-epimerase
VAPDYFPSDEGHSRRPEDLYATSKLVGEDVAAMAARKHDVLVTSIRPSWVTYPGGERTARARESFDPDTAEPNGNFWSYVDVRDVVSIVDAALDADHRGHETYLAVAAENYLDRPTAETIETVFGDLPDECNLEGDESPFSTANAREELGWEPAYSWREAENEESNRPAFLEG